MSDEDAAVISGPRSLRPRVLLSAYACEPGKGSEPEVGWQVAMGMTRHAEVTVVTRANNRPLIEAALVHHEGERPDFIYYDLPKFFLWLKKKILGPGGYYIFWQAGVRWFLRRRLEEFDQIHHVTFNGVQLPGFWIGVAPKVILGPLGGGMVFPESFYSEIESAAGKEKLRTLLIKCLRWNPLWRWTLRSADVVLAANAETAELLSDVLEEPVEVMLETAFESDRVSGKIWNRSKKESLKEILWVGGLIPRKAPLLAVKVLEKARKSGANVRLTIIGGGSMKSAIEKEVAKRGLESFVELRGRISRGEVDEVMDEVDIFLFTSLRDTSGNVILEAMAKGLPVVVPNHQGAALICTSAHAKMIDVTNPEQFVEDSAAALYELSGDAKMREAMGRSGLQRLSREFMWSDYCSKMGDIYSSLFIGTEEKRR